MRNNLRKLRKQKNISLTEMAIKLNKQPANVSYLEKKMTAKAAVECEKILDTNAFSILGEDAFTLQPRNKEDVKIIIEFLNNLEF